MVVYEPMVLETMVFSHGITYKNPSTKNRPAINRHAINIIPPKYQENEEKNDHVTKYVIELVPQH